MGNMGETTAMKPSKLYSVRRPDGSVVQCAEHWKIDAVLQAEEEDRELRAINATNKERRLDSIRLGKRAKSLGYAVVEVEVVEKGNLHAAKVYATDVEYQYQELAEAIREMLASEGVNGTFDAGTLRLALARLKELVEEP